MPHPRADITRRLLALRAPFHASVSPDGTRMLLTTSEVVGDSLSEVLRTTVLDIDSGAERPLGALSDGDHSAVWHPDGQGLAWCTTRDGRDAVALAATCDGPAQVLDQPEPAGPPVWSPDGTWLAYPARVGRAVDRTAPFRWTRPIAAFDALGPLDDPPQLRLVDRAGGQGRWLTDDGWRWGAPRWAPTGDRVAAAVSLDPSGRSGGSRLRVVHLDGRITEPAVPAGRSVVPAWLPDGRLAALVAEPHSARPGGHAQLFVVDGDRIEHVDLPDLFGDVYSDNPAVLPETTDNLLLCDHDGRLVVRTGAGGRLGIVAVDPDRPGRQDILFAGDRCCTPVAVAAGRVFATSQTITTAVEVVLRDTDGTEQQLTEFGAGLTLSHTCRVHRGSATSDGWSVDYRFLAPAGSPGPLPTVVVLHGGPHFAFGEALHLDAQALVAAGFGVLVPNVRGSTGYGDAFAQAVHGDWAQGPARDVMAVLDDAEARGWVDPDRLGVTGNSYGGYLSAWLVSTSRRFRAAVIENPVTDLVSMYATSDIGATFFPAQLGGRPHEVLDRYLEQSPLLQAHHCTTPCLFVVGEMDRRCPPSQAWAMHRVLLDAGTISEMLVLPGSSHEGSTYGPVAGRLAHDDGLVEWMTRWVASP